MGIAITFSKCGVRFAENQLVVKVDLSKSRHYIDCDIAYYCNGHEPKGVEGITAKASTFNRQIDSTKREAYPYKRGVCKECKAIFMHKNNNRVNCSKSCASKAQINRKAGKRIKLKEGDSCN